MVYIEVFFLRNIVHWLVDYNHGIYIYTDILQSPYFGVQIHKKGQWLRVCSDNVWFKSILNYFSEYVAGDR